MSFGDYATALVTGASSGIGAGVVERLAREGLKLHAVGRRKERLAELRAKTGCEVHAVDVRDTAALSDAVAHLPIDVLVNNAGINRPGSIGQATEDDLEALVDVGLSAVLQLTRILLPGMIERNRGHIVNIGSMRACIRFQGMPPIMRRKRACTCCRSSC